MGNKIKITEAMLEAGCDAWAEASSWYGPPDVEAEPVVEAIFLAMLSVYLNSPEPLESEGEENKVRY
jgi:hypothetical protein